MNPRPDKYAVYFWLRSLGLRYQWAWRLAQLVGR